MYMRIQKTLKSEIFMTFLKRKFLDFFQRKRERSNRKRVTNMNRQFMEEKVQIISKHKNMCGSISLIVE